MSSPTLPPPPGRYPVPVATGGSATVGVGRDDQVSGEAVALDLPGASLGLRLLSGLIDLTLDYGVLVVLIYLSAKLAWDTDTALFLGCLTLSPVVAFAVVPTTCETLTRGKTLGHFVVGLRTVRDDAGPIRFRHAVARGVVGVFELYLFAGVPAFLIAALSRRGKRLGDMLAGTYVIRDRFRLRLPVPPAMPVPLAVWAQGADMAALPDRTAAGARIFLQRRDNMTPELRIRQAHRMVLEVAPFVAPAPPADAPDEAVLEAILAERRRRDTDRLIRENRLRERLLR